MNNTIKKFESKLNKQLKLILKSIDGDVSLYKNEKDTFNLDIAIDVVTINASEIEKLRDSQGDIELAEAILKKHSDNLYEQNKDKIDAVEEIVFLKKELYTTKFFKDFCLVKKYLKQFNFNSVEQAEVLAFYLNNSLNFITDDKVNLAEVAAAMTREHIKNKFGPMTNFLKEKIDKNMSIVTQELKEQLNRLQLLRKIISKKGDLLPNEFAKDFRCIFDEHKKYSILEVEMEIADIILSGSEEKYMKEQAKIEEQCQKQLEQEAAIIAQQKLAEQQKHKRDKENAERKQAIQELKKYLCNDLPIRYIEEAEILLIITLLNKIGYTNEQINIIAKNINANNLKLANEYLAQINEEQDKKYNGFLKEQLSVEEQAIIYEATFITTSENALKNQIYSMILDNLVEIRTLILELDESSIEDIELLKLYISELEENVNNYKLSDYRSSSDIQYRRLKKESGDINV